MPRSQSPLGLNDASPQLERDNTFSSSDDNDDGNYDDDNYDNDNYDNDNYDDDDSGMGEYGASAASQYRFWATRPPHIPAPARNTQSRQSSSQSGSLEDALDRKSQLVVRRPAGGASGDSTGLENVMATYAALQLRTEVPGVMGRDHQSRILFVSLLENYCRTYDDDPLRNRRLFFAICRTLYSMGIVGKEYVDEMSAIRATYSDAFRQLVVRAQASLDAYERHDIETGIRSLMSSVAEGSESLNPESSYTDEWSVSHSNAMPFEQLAQNTFDVESSSDSESSDGVFSSTDSNNRSAYRPYSNHASTRSNATTAASGNDAHRLRRSSRAGSTANTFETMMMDVQRSRYHDDFIQLRCLGKGGFGKVYEVRNKLDGRPYAVKHIRIKGEITAEKTLREIKTLANLDHPNIVRYYSSWIEVARLRKRASGNRHDAHSTSPFRALYGMPPKPRQSEQSAAFGGFGMEHSGEPFTVDSPRSSLSDAWQDDSGNPFDSATGISVMSASPENSYDGAEFSFEDSFNNGEAFVMAEVSIGHTNESYDQRREAVNSIVFEQSVGGACADVSSTVNAEAGSDSAEAGSDSAEVGPDRAANAQSCPPAFNLVISPDQSICANGPLLSAGITMPAPIPIRPGVRHQRQRSMHAASDAQCARDANVNRRSMSVLSTLSGQAQSLPSQVLAGIDLAQPFVAETTLFVQMQLCQTTLQEFLLHRNQRIAGGHSQSSASSPQSSSPQSSEANAAWCEMSEHELLIDAVMNVRLFRAIVEGVKYFHTRGVIHRDLKGANVFLDIVYADSGGNPISRGGSGIGRPGTSALARRHGSMPSFGPFGAGGVHSEAWDAVDGGNLKETPRAEDSFGTGFSSIAGAGASVRSRNVDWDAVFGSIIANRSVNAGRPPNTAGQRAPGSRPGSRPASLAGASRPTSASKPTPLSRHTSSSSRLPSDVKEEQPPTVMFIPRIGDFGLATKSTLGYRATGDEYAFIGAGSSASEGMASSASVAAEAGGAQARARRGSILCDGRRTSNVGTITYAAPEQLRDQATEYNEKADIYTLGIIFFELYYPFATAMERVVVIKDLRRGVFPPRFLQMWPKEAAFILQLMDADPERRPSAREILAFDLIDVPTLESAQLKREVHILKQQLRAANQRNEELGLRVRELERIVDMSI
ncbi:hypothetical protein IW147_006002 [Coemansia sp. RSA 720]|nr:hypothetical protein IW147_006002 [Coemansia sp. RSA 720]